MSHTEKHSFQYKGQNMKWKKWLENWDMTSLKFNLKFLEMEWQPKEPDKNAAWELYIEMLTRITTQTFAAGTRRRKNGARQHLQFIPAHARDYQTAWSGLC